MASINHFDNISSTEAAKELLQPPKRRRIPSKFAEGINQLKRTINRSTKRQKLSEDNQESELQLKGKHLEDSNPPLKCTLPTGKKLALSIIIKKNIKRPPLKKLPSTKPQQKEQPKCTLLSAFLIAVQKLQTDKGKPDSIKQNGKVDQQGSIIASNQAIKKNDNKIKKQKEDEDKYLRLYDKYKLLNERLYKNQCATFWI